MLRPQAGGPSRPSGPAGSVGKGSGEVKKKMVIKPFKVQPTLPPRFEDDSWDKLKAAILAVHKQEGISFSREELYRIVEDLCVHKMGARLYERLKEECDTHVESTVRSLENQETDHELFLQKVDSAWQGHCDLFLTIRSIFLYLDRSYVIQTPSLLSIWELGLSQFRQHLQSHGSIQFKTVQGLLAMIMRERNGEAVNRGLLRDLTRMLTNLGIYRDIFLPPFLEESEGYFSREGVKKMESCDVPSFLTHVESRLQEASDAIVQYLEPHTKRPLLTAIEEQLLKPHVMALLEKGFDSLMDTNRKEDLHRMYKLLLRVPGAVDDLKKAFNGYLKRKGTEMVEDTNRDKEMIDDLLGFKAKTDGLLESAFERNDQFNYAVKDAFEYILNVRQSRTAELLAKFVDTKLKGEKGARDDDVEAMLDKVMVLFRYIGSKDVFEAFYKKDLSKRLLLGRSASDDLEKSMIAKLKAECGATFTNKLEGMFKDMDLSRELMANFAQWREANGGNSGLDMVVQVLTTGFWPAYPMYEVQVPPQLTEHMDRFTKYYSAKYQGRRLMWQHSLGTCVVRAKLKHGTKELSVSFFQALVLLCLNGGEEGVAFEEIKERTKIEAEELKRTLQSLACGKVNQRVLVKEPKGKDVEANDVFKVNHDFTHKLFRIKINTIQLKETVEEVEKTHEGVFRDRQLQVDAAIVRIMKARKTLTHTLLMSELFSQLKFPAKPIDLKKRIESLIEREYLERDEASPQVYKYLA